MSMLPPASLSLKAESVADPGDAHTKKEAADETRGGGIDPGFLKGMHRRRCP
jgi:hypothetical protein